METSIDEECLKERKWWCFLEERFIICKTYALLMELSLYQNTSFSNELLVTATYICIGHYFSLETTKPQ